MAKKKGKRSKGRKSGRLTKQEIKRAGGIKQAWRARKSGKRAKVKSPRKAAKRSSAKKATKRKSPKRSAAKRSSPKKAGKRKGGKRKSGKRKSSRSKSGSRSSSRNTTRTNTRIEKQLVVRHVPAGGLRVVGAAPKRRKKGKRKGSKKKKGSSRRKKGGQFKKGGGRRVKGAMENPMGGGELFVGFLFGAVGFMVGDAIDRGLATHALHDTGKKNAAGQEIYGDPQAADGAYKGLYNSTAICAPMDAKRWVVGILGPTAAITLAHFVSAPLGRAGLQFFGFAWGVRIAGKGLMDLMAVATRGTQLGQRLYDAEMRAIVLKSNGGNISDPVLMDLPQSGLGRPKTLGCSGNCGCANCADKAANGVGYPRNGVGYPSQPRIVDATATSGGPPPPPPPPGGGGNASPTPVVGQTTPGTSSITERTFNPGPLTGVPRGMAGAPPPPAKRNPFAWGYQDN